jgi:hypothetical protein
MASRHQPGMRADSMGHHRTTPAPRNAATTRSPRASTRTPQLERVKPKITHTPQLVHLKEGEWSFLKPSSHYGPVIVGKGVLKGQEPCVDGIEWTKMGSREHAFTGLYKTTYTFKTGVPGEKKTLKTEDNTVEANVRVMSLARTIGLAVRDAKSRYRSLQSLNLNPGGFTVANLSRYKQGGKLGYHADSEPQHAFDCVASASFGASAFFCFGAKDDKHLNSIRLDDGDLLLFDRNTYHMVEGVEGPRLNLTFRSWNDLPYWDRNLATYSIQEEGKTPNRKRSRSGDKNQRK